MLITQLSSNVSTSTIEYNCDDKNDDDDDDDDSDDNNNLSANGSPDFSSE